VGFRKYTATPGSELAPEHTPMVWIWSPLEKAVSFQISEYALHRLSGDEGRSSQTGIRQSGFGLDSRKNGVLRSGQLQWPQGLIHAHPERMLGAL
jgi:hypothetical protein